MVTHAAASSAAPVALTSDAQSHGEIAVAAGAGVYAVAWETQKTRRDKRTLVAAVIGADGTLVAPPVTVRASYPNASGVGIVWNGSAFTVVSCDDLGTAKLAWGELGTDGAYKKQGETKFPVAGDIRYCTKPVATGGGGVVFVVHGTTERIDEVEDNVVGRTCKTRRVTLAGKKLTLGKATTMCDPVGADADWVVGHHMEDGTLLASKGDQTPATVDTPDDSNWTMQGSTLVYVNGTRVAFADPPYASLRKATVTQPATAAVALSAGRFVTLAKTTDKGFALRVHGDDGTEQKSAAFTGRVQHLACAAGAQVACAWADDDRAGKGTVWIALVPTN